MNKLLKGCALAGVLMGVAAAARAEGELMVMPATTKVYHSHDQQVSAKNMGDGPLYLKISVLKVTNPGLAPENKVALGDLEHPGIIASPDKLTLGPGQMRDIVLKSLFVPKQEELYRLYIVPVRSLKVDAAPANKITVPLSVAIGYGVLVRHMPPPGMQRHGWTHRCEGGGMTLENTGNVREVFTHVVQDGASPAETIAVFPGTPQHFATQHMSLDIDGNSMKLACP